MGENSVSHFLSHCTRETGLRVTSKEVSVVTLPVIILVVFVLTFFTSLPVLNLFSRELLVHIPLSVILSVLLLIT